MYWDASKACLSPTTEKNSVPKGLRKQSREQSKYIDQCMLYNNQKPYTVALIVPNQHALKLYLEEKKPVQPIHDEGKRAVTQPD
ncbi:MAG: hypothetical protein MZV64_18470 [Ignavibacteriales bacterium]|nr:hypothetical protein [Ignavibacteriales bacterium]